MPTFGASDWDQLLQQSEELAARDNRGIPQVQRDLQQVEALSRNLRAKTARLDAGAETIAATRLLAHEGLNTRKLTRALQTFELRPTYEDVMPVESSSVQEYLDQMHEYTTIAAIQEAQRDTISAFEEYMDACMMSDWAAEKKALFDSALPDTALPGPAGQLAAASITAPYSPPQFRTPLPTGAVSQAQFAPSQTQGLRGRVKSYAETLQKLNEADRSREKMSAVAAFATAAALDPLDDGERRQTVSKLWELLRSMLAGAPGKSASAAARTHALIAGARAYLAQGHADYLKSIVKANRAQANLGGSPTRLDWTKAFLRAKEKERGPLDFDVPGGADTTWQRIYLCLRSGFDAEALEEAKALKDGALQRGGSFAAVLADYVRTGGSLPGATAQNMANEAERLLRAADRAAWMRSSFRHKALLYIMLSGDRRVAEHLFRDAGTGLLATIEDFMWYKLALVRPIPGDGPNTSGYFSGGSGEAWAFTLGDLQAYLLQFPASHYASGGREPLQYAMVLVLSLQFRAAVAFLAQDAMTKDYRVDAPHIAIALSHEQAMDAGGEGDAGHSRGLDIASLVHRYGRSFVHSNPDVALEYYMRAAQLKGDTTEVKAQLLRELLTESNAFGYLIGSGGPGGGGAMERFVSSPKERAELVGGIAAECERAAQLDWAVELYMYAGQAGAALALINDQLSNALQPALSSPARDEEAEQLIRRGADAAARMGPSSGAEDDDAQRSAFNTLKLIRQLLIADRREDFGRVAQLLGQLDFIPADQFRVQRCLDGVRAQPPAVADRLDAILAAGGRALSSTREKGALRVLADFAGSLPQRVSRATFQQLNRLQSALA